MALTLGLSYGVGEGGERALFAFPLLAAERGVRKDGDRVSASIYTYFHGETVNNRIKLLKREG